MWSLKNRLTRIVSLGLTWVIFSGIRGVPIVGGKGSGIILNT